MSLSIQQIIAHDEKVVADSFGVLAKVDQGVKLRTATEGEPGESSFGVFVQTDQQVMMRKMSSLAARAGRLAGYNTCLPGIENNTRHISLTIDHLQITFEQIETLLGNQNIEEMPELATEKSKIDAIREKIAQSEAGLHNLLLTYVKEKMVNQSELTDDQKTDLAQIFATALTHTNDGDFAIFTGFQTDPRKNTYSDKEKEGILGKFLMHVPAEQMERVEEDLRQRLDHYLPVSVVNLRELRGIGKLISGVQQLKTNVKLADIFRQIDGDVQEDGKIVYPNGSYWDPIDKMYHYKNYKNEEIRSEVKFTQKAIDTLNKGVATAESRLGMTALIPHGSSGSSFRLPTISILHKK